MSGLLCPAVLGRDGERAALRGFLDAAAAGRGGCAVLVGEAGAGKSRLVTALAADARARGIPVLTGRAVPGPHPAPYRPLADALLAAPRPDAPQLHGFTGHLARIVPAWPGAAADGSPVLLGEAVARLIGVLGAVLVLEDLHWSDPETVDALDHLAEAVTGLPALVVATTRPEGAAADLVERLERRVPGRRIPVPALAGADLDAMVAACLDGPAPPVLGTFLREHSDGNPFLVEELLAGLVASGELARDGAGWTCPGTLTPTVPATLRASVGRRLAGLDATARRVMGAAALLGRRFDWELLPGIAEVDGAAVVVALRVAVDGQLIAVEGDGFRFRHALTREAVLDDLLPPERRRLAERAWPAVERAHPGLPGPVCELAAELAEAAGAAAEAAALLVESARRALAGGALITAEAAARRAWRSGRGPDAADVLLRVLVAAGKPGDALAVGAGLDAAELPADRRADLEVVLARAALSTGAADRAAGHVRDARLAAGSTDLDTRGTGGPSDLDARRTGGPTDLALGARIDAVAAHVALARGDLTGARALAVAAGAAAAATDQPAVECEALEVQGRVGQIGEPGAGEPAFRYAADVAVRHALTEWHLRARHELALSAWATAGDVTPLRETRDLAAGYGAMATVAVMDLSLADVALGRFDRAGALEAAGACVATSRRFGLATEPVAHLWLAGAHALAGHDEAMQAAIAAALERDPDDPRILGDLHGRVLASRCVVAGDLDGLVAQLDAMMEHVGRARPGTSIFPGRSWWAVLHAAADPDGGHAAREVFASVARQLNMMHLRHALALVDAVVLGRAGRCEEAAAAAAGPYAALRAFPLNQGMFDTMMLLFARAAIRDGWGDPPAWLRVAEASFAAGGYAEPARLCRRLLAEAGAPVPRRGRGAAEVPTSLRALGVTSREVDVLQLVAAGLSTREIAERLVLSPKTVERHLASLSDRTGARGKAALGALARTHGVQSG